MATKILIGNYKGGTGKTTSTAILGTLLSTEYKVLLIDLDPQSSLSQICLKNIGRDIESFNYNENNNYKHFLKFAYDLFSYNLKNNLSLFDIQVEPINIFSSEKSCLDILPNSLFYKNSIEDEFELGLDDICVNIGNNKNNLFALPKIIIDNNFENLYDYILFDTPPSNNQITQSAFLYSDKLLIPTIMDIVSEIGVIHYWKKIDKIYSKFCSPINQDYSYFKNIFGEKIKPIGVFETMRQGMSSTIENGVRKSLSDKLSKYKFKIFETKIKELNEVIQYVYDLKSIYNEDKNVGEGTGRDIDIRGYKKLFDEIKGVL